MIPDSTRAMSYVLREEGVEQNCIMEAFSVTGEPKPMRRSELAQMIDHTNLKPDATDDDLSSLCHEAKEYRFKAVVVNPANVRLAAGLLSDSQVAVCSVVGFPLGATTTQTKMFEAQEAISNGASEIDMVSNIGGLKSGRLHDVRSDIESVFSATKARGAILKVIIEAPLLTDEQKTKVCRIAKDVGVAFVKSGTGFAGSAKAEDIRLMRKAVGDTVGVKAAGGIKSYPDALRMIEAGASRIGTSSGAAIAKEAPE